jgi:translation initiation factor 3 subunit E
MVSQTKKAWRYLDPHFLLPILDFLEEKKLAKESEVLDARIRAVSSTFMVDYLVDLFGKAKQTIPEDLEQRKASVMAEFDTKQDILRPLLVVIETEGMDTIKNMSLADFCLKYNLPTDVLDVLFEYARLSYQVGDYKTSSDLLKIYRILTSSSETTTVPTDRQIRAMWGSIASYIVLEEYTAASELIGKLMEFFDTTTLPKDKFSSGASGLWLLHWALLVLLKAQDSQALHSDLVPMILRDKYFNVVSVSSPYLWRYMSALVLLTGSSVQQLPTNEMALMISKDSEACEDPINAFIVDVFVHYNFDAAEKRIASISVTDDYFLASHEAQLRSAAKALVDQVKQRLYQQ